MSNLIKENILNSHDNNYFSSINGSDLIFSVFVHLFFPLKIGIGKCISPLNF